MNRTSVFYILLMLSVVLCISSNAATQRTLAERGAFLDHRSDSVSDLVQQLTHNPDVAARYARHFGMAPTAVSKYFEENLRLVTLQKPVHTLIFFISKNGTIKAGKRLLPAGSRVFAMPDGRLVLEWRCGNPLVGQLPKAPAPHITTAPVVQPKVTAPIIASNNIDDTSSELVTTPPVSTAVLPSLEQTATVLSPTITGVEPAVEAAAAAPVAAIPGPTILTSAKALPLLLPLLVGGSRVFNNNPKTSTVPEPATLMAFSTGLATAALAWRRQRRK